MRVNTKKLILTLNDPRKGCNSIRLELEREKMKANHDLLIAEVWQAIMKCLRTEDSK